jgi:hypothetical protein
LESAGLLGGPWPAGRDDDDGWSLSCCVQCRCGEAEISPPAAK